MHIQTFIHMHIHTYTRTYTHTHTYISSRHITACRSLSCNNCPYNHHHLIRYIFLGVIQDCRKLEKANVFRVTPRCSVTFIVIIYPARKICVLLKFLPWVWYCCRFFVLLLPAFCNFLVIYMCLTELIKHAPSTYHCRGYSTSFSTR